MNLLAIRLARAEGALVRLLGLVERRGWSAIQVSAAPVDAEWMLVRLTLTSDRPLQPLVRQLHKLYDVHTVETDR
jgi:acetolactate synthase II small subunit